MKIIIFILEENDIVQGENGRGNTVVQKELEEQLEEFERDNFCEKCGCQLEEGDIGLHPCPYSEEMHGDYEPVCNCCPNCAGECAMDV